jgi:hypothetical protein
MLQLFRIDVGIQLARGLGHVPTNNNIGFYARLIIDELSPGIPLLAKSRPFWA